MTPATRRELYLRFMSAALAGVASAPRMESFERCVGDAEELACIAVRKVAPFIDQLDAEVAVSKAAAEAAVLPKGGWGMPR